MRTLLILVLFTHSYISCSVHDPDHHSGHEHHDGYTLGVHIASHVPTVYSSAAVAVSSTSGQIVVSIPNHAQISGFQYFETASAESDPTALELYKPVKLAPSGSSRKLVHPKSRVSCWARSAYLVDGKLHVSRATPIDLP